MSRVQSYGLAPAAALLILPAIQAVFYFVVSEGPQSLRGGFEAEAVARYAGIFAFVAALTVLTVGACAALVLLLAKLTSNFNALFIVGVSAPVAIIAAQIAALVLEPDDFPLPLVLWAVAAVGGLICSAVFCAAARVPLRRALGGVPS